MRPLDLLRFTGTSLTMARQRSLLSMLGIAVGVATMVLLSAIGTGLKSYLNDNFAQFGTRLMVVTPGKQETQGIGSLVQTDRPLTLEDAESIGQLPGILYQVPLVAGTGPIQYQGRTRHTDVLGVNHWLPDVWKMELAQGRFLPESGTDAAQNVAVLGKKVMTELFAGHSALGARIRIGGERYRVIGVMASKGQILGYDMDDVVFIPTRRAQALFNREGLMEIDINFSAALSSEQAAEQVRQHLVRRHGNEDFTLITQDQMLTTLDNILGVMTAVIFAIGAIALLVGAVGIATIMTLTIRQRAGEIGLLRALGASGNQLLVIFLTEATLLALAGGLLGLLLITLLVLLLGQLGLPLELSPVYLLLALALSAGVGIVSGTLPAMQAAKLSPAAVLQKES